MILDDELRDQLDSMNEKLFDQGHEDYIINELGQVHATNKITTWFVEPGIRTEDQLRFFLDHWQYKSIPSDAITKYEDTPSSMFRFGFCANPRAPCSNGTCQPNYFICFNGEIDA